MAAAPTTAKGIRRCRRDAATSERTLSRSAPRDNASDGDPPAAGVVAHGLRYHDRAEDHEPAGTFPDRARRDGTPAPAALSASSPPPLRVPPPSARRARSAWRL